MPVIAPEKYDLLRPLFADLDFHLAIGSLLAGLSPGKVIVDDLHSPSAALACHAPRFYLAGWSEDESFLHEANRFLIENVVYENGRGFALLCYHPERWEDRLSVLAEGGTSTRYLRQYYVFRELKKDWRTMLPPGFSLLPVDAALLKRKDLKNLALLEEEMRSERPSVEDFMAKSFGLALLHKDLVVGWCLSEYNLGDRCEVGIATHEAYRRRGLATMIGSAFAEMAHEHGIRHIGWDCWASNRASGAAALSIGYEKVCEYPAYLVSFQKIT